MKRLGRWKGVRKQGGRIKKGGRARREVCVEGRKERRSGRDERGSEERNTGGKRERMDK